MRYYHFSQNNSGGEFDFDESKGITRHVVIEAENASEANQIALRIGMYWNGVSEGIDCSCCGDRWWPCNEGDGLDYPHVYSDVPEDYAIGMSDRIIAVHHKNGQIDWF